MHGLGNLDGQLDFRTEVTLQLQLVLFRKNFRAKIAAFPTHQPLAQKMNAFTLATGNSQPMQGTGILLAIQLVVWLAALDSWDPRK